VEIWRWSVGLHRLLSRRALLTIVHNRCQESILQDWGCRYLVIGYTPGEYPQGEPYPLVSPPLGRIGVISTGGLDEPLEVIFQAAGQLPEVHFYVTGKPDELPQHLLDHRPPNLHLTGYLTNPQYIGLLRGVDAIIDLTTRHNTLLMGGFEAVAVGTPLIVSDTPLLREYFSSGTIYIPNTVEGVCAGVEQLFAHQDKYRQDILHLRQVLQLEWEQNLKTLQNILQEE
jgi:glycosyltransferase involved in cell wall biosynthesis